jgi:hypothetical protein
MTQCVTEKEMAFSSLFSARKIMVRCAQGQAREM